LSDVSYPSPVWIDKHSKVVGSFLIVFGLVVIVAGYLANAFIVDVFIAGAFIGGFEIILGIWIIDIKHVNKRSVD
jgi:hypothetical protein